MTVKEMVVLLAATIRLRIPILLTGAPGVGKSDVVNQARIAAGADLILSHPVVEDPTDAKGLPWMVDGRANFLPFGQLRQAMEATRPTVWFLDDLGQAQQSMQAAYMQLVLAREVNGHRISDHVTFIAATNRRTDKAGVAGLIEPLKSRFGTIVELEPDLTSWCEWALDHDVPAEEIAFLRSFPDLLCAFKPSNDLTNSPTPRTWANFAQILRCGLPPHVEHAALAGAVGEGATSQFLAYRTVLTQMPSVDAILLSPTTAAIPHETSTLYAVCSALAYRATQGNFDRVVQYVERLMVDHEEFAALCVRDAARRHPEVTNTTAYVRLIVGKFGQLVSGATR